MIKNYLKESFKEFKDCFVAASQEGYKPLFYIGYDEMKTINIQGHQFIYYQSDAITKCMRANAQFIGLVLTNGLIAVDDLFDKLSQEAKEFVIMHETSHITLKLMPTKRSLEVETACDLQAFKYLGITDEETIRRIYKEIRDLRVSYFHKRELKKREKKVLKGISLENLDFVGNN